VGDGCRCPHPEWLLQLLLQEHLEGRVVGSLGDCKNALSIIITHSRSDSWLPSAAFSGVDSTVLLGLSWRNLVKTSLISPLQRHCSPSRAIHLAHCCLSCLSSRRRGSARRLYSSASPARNAFVRYSVMDCVTWDIHGCFACQQGPRTSRAAVTKADL